MKQHHKQGSQTTGCIAGSMPSLAPEAFKPKNRQLARLGMKLVAELASIRASMPYAALMRKPLAPVNGSPSLPFAPAGPSMAYPQAPILSKKVDRSTRLEFETVALASGLNSQPIAGGGLHFKFK